MGLILFKMGTLIATSTLFGGRMLKRFSILILGILFTLQFGKEAETSYFDQSLEVVSAETVNIDNSTPLATPPTRGIASEKSN